MRRSKELITPDIAHHDTRGLRAYFDHVTVGHCRPRFHSGPTTGSLADCSSLCHTPRMRGIQYAVTSRLKRKCLWNTGSPVCAGDDTEYDQVAIVAPSRRIGWGCP